MNDKIIAAIETYEAAKGKINGKDVASLAVFTQACDGMRAVLVIGEIVIHKGRAYAKDVTGTISVFPRIREV